MSSSNHVKGPFTTNQSPELVLKSIAQDLDCDIRSVEFAEKMDDNDPLRQYREQFTFPNHKGRGVYLCGQSLGLKPKRCDDYVQRALHNWQDKAVQCHFGGYLPAVLCETLIQEDMASLVGAKPSEVAVLNGLTVNLHLMLTTFYRPTAERFKVMIEGNAFGSDMYAVKSQMALKGFSPEVALVTFEPRQGEYCLRQEDLLQQIAKEGPQVALILLPGVQYLTGQKLDMEPLIRAGHEQGCVVGLQLAHAVGNVPLHVHDWDADFAVWCTYKYLNAGPGSLGAIFVNERHCSNLSKEDGNELLYMQGWFGNKLSTRMNMDPDFEPDDGAARFKLSNTSSVMVAMVKASLDIFMEAGLDRIHQKQFLLTGYLEYLLKEELKEMENPLKIITPSDPAQRGCQLSLQFDRDITNLMEELTLNGIDVDVRKRRAIRVAPVPLYNSFQDVRIFVQILKKILSASTIDLTKKVD